MIQYMLCIPNHSLGNLQTVWICLLPSFLLCDPIPSTPSLDLAQSTQENTVRSFSYWISSVLYNITQLVLAIEWCRLWCMMELDKTVWDVSVCSLCCRTNRQSIVMLWWLYHWLYFTHKLKMIKPHRKISKKPAGNYFSEFWCIPAPLYGDWWVVWWL